jgi:hypothetical protein
MKRAEEAHFVADEVYRAAPLRQHNGPFAEHHPAAAACSTKRTEGVASSAAAAASSRDSCCMLKGRARMASRQPPLYTLSVTEFHRKRKEFQALSELLVSTTGINEISPACLGAVVEIMSHFKVDNNFWLAYTDANFHGVPPSQMCAFLESRLDYCVVTVDCLV